MTILTWFVPEPVMRLRWMVPAQSVDIREPAVLNALPVIIGQVGQNAGDTMDGERGDIRIQGGQWWLDDIDLGTFN